VPFWSPLTPPLGISLLKGHLGKHGYNVVLHDFNADDELWQIVDRYFAILREAVPEHKQGNFHMIGFDVLSNHLSAYLYGLEDKNGASGAAYRRLLELLIKNNYFISVDPGVPDRLDAVVADFYKELEQRLVQVIRQEQPAIFGLSVFSTSLGPALYAFRRVRQLFPGIKTVMGGGVFADHLAMESPNFTRFMERTAAYIDTVFLGEGELLFQAYLDGKLEPGKRFYCIDDIGRCTLELKQAVIPDYGELALSSYSQMATFASRSCPFQCGFCSETVQWGQYRKKPGQQIATEVAAIKEKYGGRLFMFGDSLMNPVIDDYATEVLALGLDIYWDGYLRTDRDVCDREHVKRWREAGYYRARLGVESGSQRVLDLMNKKMTVQQIKTAVSTLAGQGIKTTTYWVIGYPGETETDFCQTLDLITELKDDIYEADWHPFYFFPKGQVQSNHWVQAHGITTLYPEEFDEMLFTRTWVLKTNPGREEIYDRLNRFRARCRELGIPNPYSMMEIYQADKRWKSLHPLCGPSLLELHNHHHIKK